MKKDQGFLFGMLTDMVMASIGLSGTAAYGTGRKSPDYVLG
jgi:hypothetical protein